MTYLIALNFLILLAVSALHFYWAASGKGVDDAVVPSRSDGRLLFHPGMFSTLLVALGLFFFALVTLGNSGVFDKWISPDFFRYGTWIIAAIFLARAVGDFRYVGFFKRNRGGRFARNDSRIYSPLCLLIGVISALVAARLL